MEDNVKNNYALGVLGALLGAFVGAIPWILLYIFGNMMYSILAILIVICSFYGYKLTKAKIDKKLPVILSITSFIAITVTMFLIIPMCLIMQEGFGFDFSLLVELYQHDEFVSAILTDYAISILFCLVVIGGIIVNLNKQIREGKDSKDIKIIAQDASNGTFSNKDIEKVKNIFENNNAMNKHQTITKELVMEDLKREFGDQKGEAIFNYLKVQQVIKKKSNKYYFSEKAQNSTWYRYGITSLRTFIIILVIAIVVACLIIFGGESLNNNNINTNELTESNVTRETSYEVGEDNIVLEFPDDLIVLTQDEIVYYFGEDYASAYDCVAVSSNFSKMVMIFTDYKSNYEEEYTAEEYYKLMFNDENLEVNEVEISGHTFYNVSETYEAEDGNTYVEDDYIYDAGDRFICFVFDSLEGDRIDVNAIIK